MTPRPHLLYTVAFDPPGSEGCRILAKMLASSLLRTGFGGDILIFRNSEAPLFLVGRQGLEEVFIETPPVRGMKGAEFAWCWKYRVRDHVLAWMDDRGGIGAWDKVLFLDADSLALRNIDHLLEGDWDLGFHPERGRDIGIQQFSCFLTDEECARWKRDGANSGTLAVAARHYDKVMRHWERIDTGPTERASFCRDQGSWNRVLIESGEAGLRTQAFPEGEVAFPLFLQPRFQDYQKAALVHTVGGDTMEKIRFTFGLWMGIFLCDPSALYFNFVEM
jgi:hypothetical protein